MPTRGRGLRNVLNWSLPVAGALLVLGGAIRAETPSDRAILALVGVVLLLMSSLGLQQRLLPNHRRYQALRAEVDEFVRAVRRTHAAAVAAGGKVEHAAAFYSACDDLVMRARHIGTVTAATHGLPVRSEPSNRST